MSLIRLGAVAYLNARPLVYGLELRSALFSLRFDAPSKCAALLHENAIDLGMIPSIEYLRGHEPVRARPGAGHRVGRSGRVGRAFLPNAARSPSGRSRRTPAPARRTRCSGSCASSGSASTRARADGAGLRRDAAAMRRGADHRRPGAVSRQATPGRARSTGRGMDRDDRAAVRLGVLGRAIRERCPARALTALTAARDAGVAASDRIADDYCGPARAALGRAVLEGEYPVRPGRARTGGVAAVLRAGPRARARRGDASPRVLLRSVSGAIHYDDRRSREQGPGRAAASIGTRRWSSIAARRRPPRAAGRRHPRPQASRARRHLHHRPQRQLHERLRGAVQLLRVLPAGRLEPKATCSGSTRSSGRSTRRSRSAACSCCCRAATIPTCRWSGTRICSAR